MTGGDVGESGGSDGEKLPWWRKLAYGLGDLGNSVGPGTVIPFWFSIFLTDIARLGLEWAAAFWLVVTIWDAFNDPLVGMLSDRTRTRWGRRRPYLLFGAVPFGAFFALLWLVPQTDSQAFLFTYYVVVYILYETAFTAVSCPYVALTPELTQDHDERTSLVSYRMAVSIAAGLATPLFLGQVVFPMFPERDPRAYQAMGLLCGIAFIPPLLIAFLGTRERAAFQARRAPPLRESLRSLLRNRAFRYTLALRLLSWMPVVAAQAVFAYYLTYWIGMTEEETLIAQGVILAAALVCLPLVSWLSRRLEKKSAYIVAATTWAIVMLGILFIPRGGRVPAYAAAALAGFGVAAAHVIPSAMAPDVLEVDELMSGRRQEGVYAGVTLFADKLARAGVLALLPMMLSWSGYVQPSDESLLPAQPDSALLALRLLISVFPALLLVLSIVVAKSYPLTRRRCEEIQRELGQRRGDAAS